MTATSIDLLRQLATNLRWSWDQPTRVLLDTLPGARADRTPAATLAAADQPTLDTWVAANTDQIASCHDSLAAVIAAAPGTEAGADPKIAYFSPEFGVAATVPQYSGGLGILAGDHLKAASDLSLPLLGVGLLYRQGFFRQEIAGGRQQERYEVVEPGDIGAVDTGVTVSVPVDGEDVIVRVYLQHVGSTPLVLLDTDVETNSASARSITDRLYSGDRRHRLSQELILGVGGVRALRALGRTPAVYHLNEGHACFLLLELLAEQLESGADLDTATEVVRSRTLFTTHTPVPAGIDRFDRSLAEPEMEPWAKRLGVDVGTLLDWGVLPSDGPTRPFNTAALAFEFCGRANGVSQLHATVSRELFSSLPRAARVEGITNGVHARTWTTPALAELYDDVLGPGWDDGDEAAWANVDRLPDTALASTRNAGRRELLDLAAASTGTELDPDGCVIGFARRFATYKRAALLLRDRAGLEAALDAGAQFVFAGKAHPADDEGKAVLAEVAAFAGSAESRGQLVLVPDYDIAIAQAMYAGCDVWLNNPVRPREACGTSGEKAALNGGLNCSILDGWWADWYVDGIGWAIPTSDLADPEERDDAEATAMCAQLANDVLELFHRSTDQQAWWQRVRAMLRHLGPRVTAGRMVAEYDRRFYEPIHQGQIR